jgi:aminopeptidase N
MKCLLLLLLLIASQSLIAQKLTSGGKLKPEQAIMDIRHYTIVLDVDTAGQSISGYTSIDIVLSQTAPVLLFDLMNDLHVDKIWVNNEPATFTHENALIRITPATALPAGKALVKIQYGGKPHVAVRPPWDDGFTWTHDSLGHSWIAITAEGTGGKIYFPCKDHPSDEPDEGVDMMIAVPKSLVVAGPGLLQSVKKKGSKAIYYWKTNYSINNYSIIFNVGDYKVVSKEYTTIDGNKVPMQFYVMSYHETFAMHHLELLEQMAKVKEKYFGEYPWAKEKIGIVETPHLGMEHQSMNAYGNHFKYTKVGGKDFDWLMNHEFGHEWWGNKVTAKDWADYWIHEGIGVYGDALYERDVEGEEAYINYFKDLIYGIANTTPIVQGKDIDEESAYIDDIYSKGAFFMHTLRYVIGDSIFFPTLKKLATDPQYTYNNLVNTDDVEQLFSKGAGYSLKPLFDFYLRTIQKLDIDVATSKKNEYRIMLLNTEMKLPVDVVTDKGKQRIILGKEPLIIKSTTAPQIDPDGYYLKRVISE